MKLSGREYLSLKSALVDATTSEDDLVDMVRFADLPDDDVAWGGTRGAVVGEIITLAAARDRIPELVVAARTVNETNVRLLEVATAIGVAPGPQTSAAISEPAPAAEIIEQTHLDLERMVDAERGIADLGKFSARLQEYVQRVCAIELGEEGGTGFLIGPRTLLTNHHVVKKVIDGTVPASKVVLRFDYQRDRDGVVRNPGSTTGLAEDWLVHTSPYGQFDVEKYIAGNTPGDDELDFAVLRLAGNFGNEPPAGAPNGRKRGWVEPRVGVHDFPESTYLMVVQHPCRDPISYDYANDAVIRVIGDFLRVHYRVNTMPGSSGSPVLDRNLELVALHHAGQPGSPDVFLPCKQQLTPAEYNQCIPIATIQKHLEARDLGWVFGEEGP